MISFDTTLSIVDFSKNSYIVPAFGGYYVPLGVLWASGRWNCLIKVSQRIYLTVVL
jgi:hypothetical protein